MGFCLVLHSHCLNDWANALYICHVGCLVFWAIHAIDMRFLWKSVSASSPAHLRRHLAHRLWFSLPSHLPAPTASHLAPHGHDFHRRPSLLLTGNATALSYWRPRLGLLMVSFLALDAIRIMRLPGNLVFICFLFVYLLFMFCLCFVFYLSCLFFFVYFLFQ